MSAYRVVLFSSGRWPYLAVTTWSLWLMAPRAEHVIFVDTSRNGAPNHVLRRASHLGRSISHLWLPLATQQEALSALWVHPEFVGPVLHVEEDFVFLSRVKVGWLQELVERHGVAQALFERQRWYTRERKHSTQREAILAFEGNGTDTPDGVLIRRFFSFNPSLYDAERLSHLASVPDLFHDFVELDVASALDDGRPTSLVVNRGWLLPVLHIGAVTTQQLRSAENRWQRFWLYVKIHSARRLNRVRMTLQGALRRRSTTSSSIAR